MDVICPLDHMDKVYNLHFILLRVCYMRVKLLLISPRSFITPLYSVFLHRKSWPDPPETANRSRKKWPKSVQIISTRKINYCKT